MFFDLSPTSADEALLMSWMREYGDALLRTCYLLCGDLRASREAVTASFAAAYADMRFSHGGPSPLACLLRLAFDRCPCRGGVAARGVPLAKLPPSERKAALLCLYHGLTTEEAAWVMRLSPADAEKRLARAQARLQSL